ncbi:ABC transporter ATP-binding protein [Pseudomonas sp. O230]|uniref:ABC transporter ATP-binding protein n=1 Tax=Pseudomonas sp. O230 TaxID=3159450 RepID=UPI00387B200E
MAASLSTHQRALNPLPEAQSGKSSAVDSANNIRVEGVGLTFLNGHVGLKATSLEINGGEFCTLLGPSGSGKTTLLRTIAGLIAPTTGQIFIGKSEVTNLPVQARNIGFVFQNYALFPHMNVAQNLEYPLKLHGWTSEERSKRVKEVLELIELSHVAERLVGELSGGQQQRVAIGRALAYRPSLLLLDEPMGALDRRLRQQLGAQLREIQQRTGITAVYVTHDQEEAFILSDRVAIMEQGKILQYSSPSDLYFRPSSRFVAKFLGEVNLLEVSSLRQTPEGAVVETAFGPIPVISPPQVTENAALTVVVRPEHLMFLTTAQAPSDCITPIQVMIEKELFLGSRSLVTVTGYPAKQKLLVECTKAQIPPPDQPTWVTWKRSAAVLVTN